MKNVFSKGMMGSVIAVSMLASVSASAGNLPPIDSVVTTTFDKSIIHGSLAHTCDSGEHIGDIRNDCTGPLAYDGVGNARFQYTGKIYAVATNNKSGQLVTLANQIGDISGEAAFPKDFVAISTYVNGKMDEMMAIAQAGGDPTTVELGQFPAIIPWTCNHCDMTVAGHHYVSIVDALDPNNPLGLTDTEAGIAAALQQGFDANVAGDNNGNLGAAVSLAAMRMDGRAFTGLGPASFDPATKTMGIRMAGCSALVDLTAMKIGTLCMNATAVFDVSSTVGDPTNANGYGYDETSQISAEGSSNCVTVMQPMPQP